MAFVVSGEGQGLVKREEFDKIVLRLEGEKELLGASLEEQQRQAGVEIGEVKKKLLNVEEALEAMRMRKEWYKQQAGQLDGRKEYYKQQTMGLETSLQTSKAAYDRYAAEMRATNKRLQDELTIQVRAASRHDCELVTLRDIVRKQQEELAALQQELSDQQQEAKQRDEEQKTEIAALRQKSLASLLIDQEEEIIALRDKLSEIDVFRQKQIDVLRQQLLDQQALHEASVAASEAWQAQQDAALALVGIQNVHAAVGDQAALTQAAVDFALREHRIDIFKWTVKVVPGPDGKPRAEYIATFAPQVLPVASIAQCEKKVGLEKDLAARCAELFFDGLVRDEEVKPLRLTRRQLLAFIKTTCTECGIPVDKVIELVDALINKKLKQKQRQEDEDEAFDAGLTLYQLHADDEQESARKRARTAAPVTASAPKAPRKRTRDQREAASANEQLPTFEVDDLTLGDDARSRKRRCVTQPAFSACSDNIFDDDL